MLLVIEALLRPHLHYVALKEVFILTFSIDIDVLILADRVDYFHLVCKIIQTG